MVIVLLLSTVAYGCDLLLSAIASGVGWAAVGVGVMPALMSYAVYYHSPACAIAVAAVFGIASDLLAGTQLGTCLIVSLSLWFACASTASLMPRARGALLWAHMLIACLLWRILAAALLTMQGQATVGSLDMSVILAVMVEATLGLWIARKTHQLLEYAGQRRALSDMLFVGQP
ncbi:MAG: hypothetical protein AAF310_00155 [Myxococcota bacterium]